VKIQKEFKVTPHYMEIEHDADQGFRMGVYLCLGRDTHNLSHKDAIYMGATVKTFKDIQEYMSRNEHIFLFLGEGMHKIKRKAEQEACFNALRTIDQLGLA
jgi:hypothetical protein